MSTVAEISEAIEKLELKDQVELLPQSERADILGVSSPPSLASWSVVSMRPSAGLVAAGSGRLSSSMTVPFGEIGNS